MQFKHNDMKPQHLIYCLAVMAVLFTACKKDKDKEEEQEISVTGVTLNQTELTLLPGDTVTLIATVEPDNATNKTVTWTSSNPNVATVNEGGVVTAVANGNATITTTTQDGNQTTTCVINVDYRNEWIEDWEYNIHCSYPIWIVAEEVFTWVTVDYDYSGWIAKSQDPQKIVVHWGEDSLQQYLPDVIFFTSFNQTNELTVDTSGKLSYPEYGGFGHTRFYGGEIFADTIHFEISYGGLGSYIAWDVSGTKSNKHGKKM